MYIHTHRGPRSGPAGPTCAPKSAGGETYNIYAYIYIIIMFYHYYY